MILRANRTFAGWVGCPPQDLVKLRFQDLLSVGGKIFYQTHWEPLLRMQGSISEVKLEIAAAAERVPVVFNVIRRDDGTGSIVHDIAAYVARDRDRYERELVASRKRLEGVVAELGVLHAAETARAVFAERMMGIVGHDLRNPIHAIQMGTDLLAARTPTEAQASVLAKIGRATARASALIDDLLDFTSASLGTGLRMELATVALHAVIADGLDELRLQHPALSVLHRREGAETCRADGRRLVQLVGNLVSNAIVYGDAARTITVTTTVGATCEITVHNHGAAIAAELQATMFEPMTRGEKSGARRSVGLGLYIVRQIARAHGGTATVASTSDGTTFRVAWSAAG